ncbi:MAG TPA: prephenate dehydrogenase/arogenate dehydrogenase family protein [Anaerolineales bacterium]|nr:prephenate dehydrogenase/arogenate dehydrogenase family protein [Anaerolineales bacterium]
MEDGFRLRDSKIAIVGLGLMGGSLALALQGKCAALYGIDSDHATRQLALDKQIVDEADSNPAKLLPRADLIVLSTPVPTIIEFIHRLPALVQQPCVILDLGSTKKDILQAMSALPDYFDPIGGHPICGKERLGLENAESGLFQNASFVITLLERTTSRARTAAKEIVSVIGAHLIEMDAEEHDRALAHTSHLPFLLASALAHSTPSEFSTLIGSGFRSTARLAGSPASMTLGILQSNRENVLRAIQSFQASLNQIVSALQAENHSQLESLLNESRTTYHSLVSNL